MHFEWTDELVKKLVRDNRQEYDDKDTAEFAHNLVEKFKSENQHPPAITINGVDVYKGDTIYLLNVSNWSSSSFTVPNNELISLDKFVLAFLTEEDVKMYIYSHRPVFSNRDVSLIRERDSHTIKALLDYVLTRAPDMIKSEEFKACVNLAASAIPEEEFNNYITSK